jgi:hydrogenase assembly chaperone HypC/HupF
VCLSDLGRVVDVDPGRRCASVDIGGRVIEVSTVTLGLDEPQPAVGDWLVVHTGFAVERLSATAAAEIHHARHELTPFAVEPTREEPS